MACPYTIVCKAKRGDMTTCIMYPFKEPSCSSCEDQECRAPLGKPCSTTEPCYKLVDRLPKELLKAMGS